MKERLLYAETTINDPVSISLAFKKLANSISCLIKVFCRRKARAWAAGVGSCVWGRAATRSQVVPVDIAF